MLLAGPVENPTDPDEKVDCRLSDEDRRVAIKAAEGLAAELGWIVEKCFDPQDAVTRLKGLFGERIPSRPDLVDVTKAAHAEVRSHERRISAAPVVGKSTSA